MEFVQLIVTVPNREKAKEIAKVLLEKRLAACIQIFKVESSFRWEGKIEECTEYAMFIKTKRTLFKRIEEEILSLHPYSVPEIIALPIVEGYKKYTEWMRKELS